MPNGRRFIVDHARTLAVVSLLLPFSLLLTDRPAAVWSVIAGEALLALTGLLAARPRPAATPEVPVPQAVIEVAAAPAPAAPVEAAPHPAEQDCRADVGQLAVAAAELIDRINAMGTVHMEVGFKTMSADNDAEQASLNVEKVADEVGELTATIEAIAARASEAKSIAGKAVQVAGDAGATVQSMVTATGAIRSILTTITAIAQQTNMLALNATIEAARAGEAGKGFAVVASEVKSLAQQTADATKLIAGEVTRIASINDQAIHAIADVTAIIGHIDEVQGEIATAVEAQGNVTRCINGNAHEVAERTRSVSQLISDIARSSDECGERSIALSQQAEDLRTGLGQLQQALGS